MNKRDQSKDALFVAYRAAREVAVNAARVCNNDPTADNKLAVKKAVQAANAAWLAAQ